MTKIRDVVTMILGGYAIFIWMVVTANAVYNITIPCADYIVCGGGGIMLMIAVLMVTTFKEGDKL